MNRLPECVSIADQLFLAVLIAAIESRGMSVTAQDLVNAAGPDVACSGIPIAEIYKIGALKLLLDAFGGALLHGAWGVGNQPTVTPETDFAIAVNTSDNTIWTWYDNQWH